MSNYNNLSKANESPVFHEIYRITNSNAHIADSNLTERIMKIQRTYPS